MLPLPDDPSFIDEPKDTRMEFRTKRRVKETIQAAAALSGVDDSTFAMTAAYRAAVETINAHERTTLAPADRKAFFNALDNPGEPNDSLRGAFAAHERLIRDGR